MKIIRNIVVTFLVLSGAGILALGPRGDTVLPPDRVIIEYWEKWTGREAAQMKLIVDQFNETVGREKGIFVRYLSMSAVHQKTLVATAAGVPPDLAGLWDAQVAQFAARDALEPLDDLAAEYGITPDTYKPVYWRGCTYDGKLWALISTPAAVALLYNKRAFQEAGLDPLRPPQTIDELDRYALALDTRHDGRIDRSGYLPVEPGWFLAHTALWFGGTLFDESTGRFTLTDPRVVRAFDWVQSYSRRLGPDSVTEFRSGLGGFNSTHNPFLVGKVVMQQQGPWMANFIYNLRPAMSEVFLPKLLEVHLPPALRQTNYEWGVAAFPSADPDLRDVTFAGFDVLVIPRGARHKREAFEFIAFVNRQDVMEKLCSMHGKNSPLAKVSDSFIRNHVNPYIDVFERLSASPNAHPVPAVPIMPEVMEEMSVAVQRIYLLEATAAEALAESQQRLQQKLDRFFAKQQARRLD